MSQLVLYPADYERHGNNNLNNGQHVFTLEEFTGNTEEKCEAMKQSCLEIERDYVFCPVEQTDRCLFLRS